MDHYIERVVDLLGKRDLVRSGTDPLQLSELGVERNESVAIQLRERVKGQRFAFDVGDRLLALGQHLASCSRRGVSES